MKALQQLAKDKEYEFNDEDYEFEFNKTIIGTKKAVTKTTISSQASKVI